MSITSLRSFEDQISDRLNTYPSGSGSITSNDDFLVEDSPAPSEDPIVRLDDSRQRLEERTISRDQNLPTTNTRSFQQNRTRPSDNFRSITNRPSASSVAKQRKQEAKQPKYKYVVMPRSLLGIKLQEGETFVGNLLSEGLTGAGIGGVFGGVGSLIGAGAGILSGIFGGRKKDLWFDVVYKDALQEAFQQLGLKITDKPFGGNSLTVKSQFGIDSKVTVEDMVKVLNQFNQRLGQEFRSKPQIVNGLAGVRIQDSYDKETTLFRFAVQYPEPKKPTAEQAKVASGSGNAVKSAVGVGTLIGLITLLRG